MGAQLKRILPGAVLLVLLVYAGDYLSLRFRIPARDTFGSVEVQRYYEVALKNRKTEFMRAEPARQTCVHSLLPHYGDTPCWYLEGHRRQTIKVGSNPSDFWKMP